MTDPLKIILSVDALQPPLTGIGRYTWELATRLPAHDDIAELRLRTALNWVASDDLASLVHNLPQSKQAQQAGMPLSRLLRRLKRATGRIVAPWLQRRAFSGCADYLYHGPNFYLPNFPGRTVATIHDLSIFRYPQFHPPLRVAYMKREIPRTLQRANFLITDSEFTCQEIIAELNWPADKVRSVPLGVPENFYPRSASATQALCERHNLRHGAYVLCVSTIEPRKNIDTLLSAYEALPVSLRSRVPLVLAGDQGWRSESIHQRFARAESQGWLKYLGYVGDNDLPLLFAGALGFAFPSFYEGFGLPVLEAMASGVPVVCSNAASLPEVAQGCALLVEPQDTQAWTMALQRLLEDAEWRAQTSVAASAAARIYTWDLTVKRTIAAYREALSIA